MVYTSNFVFASIFCPQKHSIPWWLFETKGNWVGMKRGNPLPMTLPVLNQQVQQASTPVLWLWSRNSTREVPPNNNSSHSVKAWKTSGAWMFAWANPTGLWIVLVVIGYCWGSVLHHSFIKDHSLPMNVDFVKQGCSFKALRLCFSQTNLLRLPGFNPRLSTTEWGFGGRVSICSCCWSLFILVEWFLTERKF